MLRLQNVCKRYGGHDGVVVLDDLSLEVATGEFVCVVGPSGCGKSTLLNIIAGFERPTGGTVERGGKVGFMFQEPTLFPWLKVKDNVAFGLKMMRLPQKDIDARVQRYLSLVHLTEFRDAYPRQLSGGMKQRAALARVLALDPDVLLMDEPFAALDVQTREELYVEFQDIWQRTGKTVVFITHNVREAVCLGDRVVVLSPRPGSIVREFPVDLPRPREIDHLEVARLARAVHDELKMNQQHSRV